MRAEDDLCKRSETVECFNVPWFKHFDAEWIEKYAAVFRKVIENHEQLLDDDQRQGQGGRWYGTENA